MKTVGVEELRDRPVSDASKEGGRGAEMGRPPGVATLDTAPPSTGAELSVQLNLAEATGLAKACDSYCVCTLQLDGPQVSVGGLFSPRGKSPGTQLVRTETVRRSDTPRWKTGQAEFRHIIEDNPRACLEVSLLATRLLGSELLGRAHIELAELLSEPKSDRWYPVKSKHNQDAGNVRLQTAGGRDVGAGGIDSLPNNTVQHPRDSLMYLQNNPPPGTPGGIPAPTGALFGGGSPVRNGVQRPPQRPGRSAFSNSGGDAGLAGRAGGADVVGGGGGLGVVPFTPYGGGARRDHHAPATQSASFQYKFGDMVGKGAFGKVFQALNLNSGELMAVKCVEFANMTEEDVAEIRNEVQLLRHLKHRHVVQYIATHEMDSSLNILMEYCPGGSVASLSRSFGPFPEAVVAQYSRQLMEGIAYVHQNNVMHRDIKGT